MERLPHSSSHIALKPLQICFSNSNLCRRCVSVNSSRSWKSILDVPSCATLQKSWDTRLGELVLCSGAKAMMSVYWTFKWCWFLRPQVNNFSYSLVLISAASFFVLICDLWKMLTTGRHEGINWGSPLHYFCSLLKAVTDTRTSFVLFKSVLTETENEYLNLFYTND